MRTLSVLIGFPARRSRSPHDRVQIDGAALPGRLAGEGPEGLSDTGHTQDVAVDHLQVLEVLGGKGLAFGLAQHQLDP
jgi:hypothetical protein